MLLLPRKALPSFVKSEEVSLSSDTKSSAALAARNVVEAIRHNGGSPEQALKSAAAMLGGNCEGQPANVDVGMLSEITIIPPSPIFFSHFQGAEEYPPL